MNKLTKITAKQYVYTVFTLLLAGSYILMATIWLTQRSENRTLTGLIDNTNQTIRATNGSGYNAVSIVPSDNAVYLPLAKLKLPATDLNEGLVYTYTPPHHVPGLKRLFNAELDISTHDLSINNYPTAQFDCTEVVYADFVTPSYPVNPMWKSDGSVTLADGRTMNIYYAPSVQGCQQSWTMSEINPKAIAGALKQAVSY